MFALGPASFGRGSKHLFNDCLALLNVYLNFVTSPLPWFTTVQKGEKAHLTDKLAGWQLIVTNGTKEGGQKNSALNSCRTDLQLRLEQNTQKNKSEHANWNKQLKCASHEEHWDNSISHIIPCSKLYKSERSQKQPFPLVQVIRLSG